MKDLANDILIRPCIAPAVVTDNTAQVGAIIDRQGYQSVVYGIVTGTLDDADTALTVLLEEGDDSGLSDATAVADIDLNNTEALAAPTFADDGEAFKLGYVGNKRYTRMTITPANNTGNIPIAAVAIMGNPENRPAPLQ